ncbi:MAG TPA: malto-oligosyltrehalose synthase [Candidatus Acidoferrales bacterium]|jgi:(1->4)-alpha-D-glucan 1-alpha-D-glucosylmutase|nr:malto-oligosyltrehalose synthase [Candidatus Acidoferrales bacterium]
MRIPSATYRLQFNARFRFHDAEKIVPYLHDLGISHLYASPVLQAKSGSEHGYDVADPTRLNADLGTDEDFERLTTALKQHGMGLFLDIVPNHMASTVENPWWADLLTQGEDSPYATYFDIDWQSSGSKFPVLQRGRIVLPVLSDFYDHLLTEQRLVLRFGENGFFIEAEGNPFPLNPRTYSLVLGRCIQALKSAPQPEETLVRTLEEIIARLQNYDGIAEANPAIRDLWRLFDSSPSFHSALDATLTAFNGIKGDPASFDTLNDLLSAQVYRLAFWRNASEEVNYRRFFGLNELVALRIENCDAFRDDHARIFQMVAAGQVDGLRIDHIDGLRDPMAYLERLQKVDIPADPQDSDALRTYTVVEKITSGRETLPKEWPTAGTTGYDYLNAVNTLFVDAVGSRQLEEIYRHFTGIRSSFGETWNVRKKQVMEEMFASDIRRLTWRLGHLAALDRLGTDIPMRELVRGLKEITAALPIYRTYFRDLQLLDRDRPYLTRAFEIARERAPQTAVSDAGFDFLQSVFLLRPSRDLHKHKAEWLDFLESWQQFTGAVMGKGLEDTAFFVHHGLISLNEVGTNPLRKEIAFGVTAFHRYNLRTKAERPFTLNTTSTHDTKWSEGVRARINVLSEMPGEWKTSLESWSQWNHPKKSMVDGRLVPSPNEEVLLYQSMLGIWPVEPLDAGTRAKLCDRLQKFMLKAAREAKTHSSWVSPNEAHENALKRFICSVLNGGPENNFLSDFSDFAARIAPAGICNACAQVLLKIASPGVPDFYQGNELWDLRLTDPDNRNPVDFVERMKLLGELPNSPEGNTLANTTELLAQWQDSRLKLYLTREALNFRRANRGVFLKGVYLPLEIDGSQRHSVCAFARHFENSWALVVVPRLTASLPRESFFPLKEASWGSTSIALPPSAPATWKNIFTGEDLGASRARRRKSLTVASVFSRLPFALLHSPS